MNELLERLKMYEPLFGQWKVDFIAINYGDMKKKLKGASLI